MASPVPRVTATVPGAAIPAPSGLAKSSPVPTADPEEPHQIAAQSSSTLPSCERIDPLVRAYEPSNTAEPMVKASAPASAMSPDAVSRGYGSCNDQTVCPQSPACRLDQFKRVGVGCPVGQKIDAGAARVKEFAAIGFNVFCRAAELGGMARGLAGERIVKGAGAFQDVQDINRRGAAQQAIDAEFAADPCGV